VETREGLFLVPFDAEPADQAVDVRAGEIQTLRRVHDIPDVVADITAIRNAIGWSPSINLIDGLQGMIAHHRNNLSSAVIKAPTGLNVPEARNHGG